MLRNKFPTRNQHQSIFFLLFLQGHTKPLHIIPRITSSFKENITKTNTKRYQDQNLSRRHTDNNKEDWMINIHCPDCNSFMYSSITKLHCFLLLLVFFSIPPYALVRHKNYTKKIRNDCIAVQPHRQFTFLFSLLQDEVRALQQINQRIGSIRFNKQMSLYR
jgi:hypothetical protein